MLIDPTYVEVQRAIIRRLRDTGHFWDETFPNLLNVGWDDTDKLTIKDRVVRDAVESFQRADLNYTLEGLRKLGREPAFDGDVGPATLGLLTTARCPLPDHAPPPNARFGYDDPDLQKAVESMQKAAANPPMKGEYWRGCDPQNPGVHSLVIGIDAKNAPSQFIQNQEHILSERRRIAAEIGVSVRFVVNPQTLDGLQQLQVYRNIPGGTIGINYFPQRNSCSRIPNGSMDSTYNPSNLRLHISLGTHESEGHGFGFNHTRGGIMNPSILDTPLQWKDDPAWNQVIRYYPGEPLDLPTPQPPVPPIPPTPVPGLPNIAIDWSARELRVGSSIFYILEKPSFG